MTFNQLFESTYNQNLQNEPKKFVEFFEHNRILIEGQNIKRDEYIYDKVTRLISDYANSLVHLENHRKAEPFINKAIELFEEHPHYRNQDLFELTYYETLIFDRALANYRFKNYSLAKKDFNELNRRFPTNDLYKSWKIGSKLHITNTIQTICFYGMAITILGSWVIDESSWLRNLNTGLLVTFIFGSLLIKWHNWEQEKKSI